MKKKKKIILISSLGALLPIGGAAAFLSMSFTSVKAIESNPSIKIDTIITESEIWIKSQDVIDDQVTEKDIREILIQTHGNYLNSSNFSIEILGNSKSFSNRSAKVIIKGITNNLIGEVTKVVRWDLKKQEISDYFKITTLTKNYEHYQDVDDKEVIKLNLISDVLSLNLNSAEYNKNQWSKWLKLDEESIRQDDSLDLSDIQTWSANISVISNPDSPLLDGGSIKISIKFKALLSQKIIGYEFDVDGIDETPTDLKISKSIIASASIKDTNTTLTQNDIIINRKSSMSDDTSESEEYYFTLKATGENFSGSIDIKVNYKRTENVKLSDILNNNNQLDMYEPGKDDSFLIDEIIKKNINDNGTFGQANFQVTEEELINNIQVKNRVENPDDSLVGTVTIEPKKSGDEESPLIGDVQFFYNLKQNINSVITTTNIDLGQQTIAPDIASIQKYIDSMPEYDILKDNINITKSESLDSKTWVPEKEAKFVINGINDFYGSVALAVSYKTDQKVELEDIIVNKLFDFDNSFDDIPTSKEVFDLVKKNNPLLTEADDVEISSVSANGDSGTMEINSITGVGNAYTGGVDISFKIKRKMMNIMRAEPIEVARNPFDTSDLTIDQVRNQIIEDYADIKLTSDDFDLAKVIDKNNSKSWIEDGGDYKITGKGNKYIGDAIVKVIHQTDHKTDLNSIEGLNDVRHEIELTYDHSIDETSLNEKILKHIVSYNQNLADKLKITVTPAANDSTLKDVLIEPIDTATGSEYTGSKTIQLQVQIVLESFIEKTMSIANNEFGSPDLNEAQVKAEILSKYSAYSLTSDDFDVKKETKSSTKTLTPDGGNYEIIAKGNKFTNINEDGKNVKLIVNVEHSTDHKIDLASVKEFDNVGHEVAMDYFDSANIESLNKKILEHIVSYDRNWNNKLKITVTPTKEDRTIKNVLIEPIDTAPGSEYTGSKTIQVQVQVKISSFIKKALNIEHINEDDEGLLTIDQVKAEILSTYSAYGLTNADFEVEKVESKIGRSLVSDGGKYKIKLNSDKFSNLNDKNEAIDTIITVTHSSNVLIDLKDVYTDINEDNIIDIDWKDKPIDKLTPIIIKAVEEKNSKLKDELKYTLTVDSKDDSIINAIIESKDTGHDAKYKGQLKKSFQIRIAVDSFVKDSYDLGQDDGKLGESGTLTNDQVHEKLKDKFVEFGINSGDFSITSSNEDGISTEVLEDDGKNYLFSVKKSLDKKFKGTKIIQIEHKTMHTRPLSEVYKHLSSDIIDVSSFNNNEDGKNRAILKAVEAMNPDLKGELIVKSTLDPNDEAFLNVELTPKKTGDKANYTGTINLKLQIRITIPGTSSKTLEQQSLATVLNTYNNFHGYRKIDQKISFSLATQGLLLDPKDTMELVKTDLKKFNNLLEANVFVSIEHISPAVDVYGEAGVDQIDAWYVLVSLKTNNSGTYIGNSISVQYLIHFTV